MTEKKRTTRLRSPYYELGDKIGKLENVSYELKDEKLKKLVLALSKQRDAIYKYINSNYIWD